MRALQYLRQYLCMVWQVMDSLTDLREPKELPPPPPSYRMHISARLITVEIEAAQNIIGYESKYTISSLIGDAAA